MKFVAAAPEQERGMMLTTQNKRTKYRADTRNGESVIGRNVVYTGGGERNILPYHQPKFVADVVEHLFFQKPAPVHTKRIHA